MRAPCDSERYHDDGVASLHKFTGKERDTEPGLDYFGARYYGSNMGRWMTPDWSETPSAVPYADLSNPQSLNLYADVGNNPVSRSDADGHDCTTILKLKVVCWNQQDMGEAEKKAERAHEDVHMNEPWSTPGWKEEQNAFKAEQNVVENRLNELNSKKELTEAEKKEKKQLEERSSTDKTFTEGPEAERNSKRYYRNNQNWLKRLFIENPDKDISKPKPPQPKPPQPPPPPPPPKEQKEGK